MSSLVNRISVSLKMDKFLIILLNFNILLFLFRTSFPFFKYPFVLFYVILIIYIIINKNSTFISSAKIIPGNYWIIILLVIYIFFGLYYSDKIYLTVIKDLMNIMVLLSFFFIGTTVISLDQTKFWSHNFNIQIIIFAAFIAVTLLLNQFNIIPEDSLYSSMIPSIYSTSHIEYIDTNFSLIPIFLAIICLSFLLTKINSSFIIVFSNLLLFLFIIPIVISGSKRGMFLLSILLISFVLVFITTRFIKNPFLKIFRYNTRILMICLLLCPVFIYAFVKTSYNTKSDFLSIMGTKDITAVRYKIASNLFRYVSVVDKKTDLTEFYSSLWNIDVDARNPDSGWGIRIHKSIYPLKGENVGIIPIDVIGYKMDNTCDVVVNYNKNVYSRTLLSKKVISNNYVHASVYCFVSHDFNGDMASIEIVNRKGTIKSAEFDLNRKNLWQKLDIIQKCQQDTIELALWFSKYNAENFNTLKGYVIFANPVLQVQADTNSYSENEKANYYYVFKETKKKPIKYLIESSLFSLPFRLLNKKDTMEIKTDPIRELIAKIVSEDTVYHGYKANLIFSRAKDNFGEDRTSLWKFALEVFNKEYSRTQKFFGGGFNFLNWYGYCFDGDKKETDYPHNPFLHILLYSGILGLSIYIFFLLKVFYFYVKYIKEYPAYFTFFLINFYFTFFSGGTPFDPPVMGFLLILPFFIHSIHKKEYLKRTEKRLDQNVNVYDELTNIKPSK